MKITILSNNDWDGLWYQRQQFASMFANEGHEILFVNKTLQRLPKIKDFKERFFKRKSNCFVNKNSVPDNIRIINLYTLPPIKIFNHINKFIIKKNKQLLKFKYSGLLITYVPTYTSLNIIEMMKPDKTAYINVHNYDADEVVKDLLKSEKIICKRVNYLFGDSSFNIGRLKKISGGRIVFDSEPGVDSDLYEKAYRGDEANLKKKICYFGGIGWHLDLALYNELSNYYEITFIGKFNDDLIKEKLSKRICIIPPVSNDKLPGLLREVDIIGLFYKESGYVNGVIPAKIYECISTLKPTIVSGMQNIYQLKDCIYISESNISGIDSIIKELINTENPEIIERRKIISKSANWNQRFMLLKKRLEI